MKKFTFLIILLICSSIKAQMPPPPVLEPGEKWTNLYSVSYDYQTNGSIRYLVEDPTNTANLCALIMAQQDTSTATGVQRYMYFSYSDNGGNTWTSDVLNNSANWGFGNMTVAGGVPVIVQHRFNVLTNVSKDVIFGGFSFSDVGVMPTNIIPAWPHITGTDNGNIVVVASTNDGASFPGYYSTYNGSAWSDWSALAPVGGPSGNYAIASGTNGVVGIFGTAYLSTGALYYFKSTNNGLTFDNGTMIFDYIIEGSDTLFANITGGLEVTYIGEEPHLAFTVYNVSANIFPNVNTIEFIKPRIMHWSPSNGLSQIAGKFNIPELTDTITNALVAPVGQPSISRTNSGKLICSFTGYLRGYTQIVDNGDAVNAGEIFVSRSDNNGVTWSAPVNITNTSNIEEKHSSLMEKSSTDSLKIFYLRDLKAGGWVNIPAWGKAPVYGIYKSGEFPVGINQINSIAESYDLSQNYPNPFNPSTNIKFSLKKSGFTSLIIYDALGKEITKLVNGDLGTGSYQFEFSADRFGLSSGLYFYKLTSGDFSEVKQMMLIK